MPAKSLKAQLRADFEDFDYYTAKVVALSKRIKETAPAFWLERGYTVQPRLEKLRAAVFESESTNSQGETTP